MTAKDLVALYGATQYTFTTNMQDITHEIALRTSDSGGSSINWILGHVLRTRQSVLELLGQEPVISPDDLEQYVKGDGFTEEKALPLDQLTQLMNDSFGKMTRGFARVSQERLDEDIPEPFLGQQVTCGRMVGLFNFHEAYHFGQIGILRRVFGLDGKLAKR